MSKLGKLYISRCKALFPILQRKERLYLKNLRLEVEDYIADKNIPSIDVLYNHFGTPESVLNNYLSMCDIQLIVKRIRYNSILTKIVWALALILSILFLIYEVHLIKHYNDARYHSIITSYEEVIE